MSRSLDDLGGDEVILLVDDEPHVRKLARTMLVERGYRVLDAGSGEEALSLSSAEKGPIHVLVTDVMMPEMTGLELFRKLAPLRPALKVLYISGYTADAISDRGLALDGRMAFLAKPFDATRLCVKVRLLLDGARAAVPSA